MLLFIKKTIRTTNTLKTKNNDFGISKVSNAILMSTRVNPIFLIKINCMNDKTNDKIKQDCSNQIEGLIVPTAC